jgi:hypothetical protein
MSFRPTLTPIGILRMQTAALLSDIKFIGTPIFADTRRERFQVNPPYPFPQKRGRGGVEGEKKGNSDTIQLFLNDIPSSYFFNLYS